MVNLEILNIIYTFKINKKSAISDSIDKLHEKTRVVSVIFFGIFNSKVINVK